MHISKSNHYMSWLVGALLMLVALTSCTPEVLPDEEIPTATALPTQAPTRTSTPPMEMTPTPTEIPSLEIEPDVLAGTVVRFAHPWVGEPAEMLEKIAREFSLTNPWDISVEVYPHGGEMVLVQDLGAILEAGEAVPGLIAVRPYLLPGVGGDFAVSDLRPYFNDPNWGFDADSKADLMQIYMEPFTRDERMIALPFAPQATVLFYNMTWGEALGFSGSPTNLDTFKRQTCDATFANWQDETKQNGTGGWLINLEPGVLASWYYAFEGVLPAENIPSFNNEFGQEAFGYLWDIKNQGCTWFGLQPDPYNYFANRLALVYAGRLDQIPVQMNWMEAVGSEDEWEVIGFPGPVGETITVDGPGLMITADSPENELAAWLFAKHLLESKIQAKIVRSMFTLPVRESALDLLTDFETEYPQWGQGAAMIDSASALPASDGWGVAQWALQDAVFRILMDESGEVTLILEQLDNLILDLAGTSP